MSYLHSYEKHAVNKKSPCRSSSSTAVSLGPNLFARSRHRTAKPFGTKHPQRLLAVPQPPVGHVAFFLVGIDDHCYTYRRGSPPPSCVAPVCRLGSRSGSGGRGASGARRRITQNTSNGRKIYTSSRRLSSFCRTRQPASPRPCPWQARFALFTDAAQTCAHF